MSRRTATDPTDELYRSPLAGFVRARNALAARLAKSGHPADAKRVRALAKPKATVWGVNRLARTSPKLIDRVLKAFDALKHAQLRRPEQFRAASEGLRAAVDAAVDHAQSRLAAEGLRVSLDARRRMDATLRGAAAGARDALVRGALTHELAAPGFELFAGASPSGRPLRAVRGSRSAAPRSGHHPDEGGVSARASAPPAPDRAEMLKRRAAQLEEEAVTREREATAAAAALMEERQRLRELEQRARAAQRAAAKSRRTAARARTHADRRSRTR